MASDCDIDLSDEELNELLQLNNDSLKDLVQEVYFHIWKALPNFKGKSALSTWVYRICLNVCLRASYLKKREKLVPFDSFTTKQEEPDDTYDNDLRKKLHHCISQLKGIDKSIMLLFLEDISYKEIAEIVGISENYVAVKIKRIKRKLFNCIKN